jgi:hypothetical protein
MMATVLSYLGIDLQQEIDRLQARAETFTDRTVDRAVDQVKRTGIVLGLALTGVLLILLTVGIGLLALYHWVAVQYGVMAGLGAAAGAAATVAIVLFLIAAGIGHKPSGRVPTSVPPEPPKSRPAPSPQPSASAAAASLAAMVPPPPPGSPLLDIVSHRVTAKAAAASEDAVNAAVDFVRSGSRSALFGTLAATVLVGLLIGRRTP